MMLYIIYYYEHSNINIVSNVFDNGELICCVVVVWLRET